MKYPALASLDKLVGEINTHPDFDPQLRENVRSCINRQAAFHSYLLELQESEEIADPSEVQVREEHIQNLSNAWDHLEDYGISLSSLSRLGGYVEPEVRDNSRYRHGTEVNVFGYEAPNNVQQEMENLVWRLDNWMDHPVLRAIEAHTEMVRIQPYRDGNKRSGRLLQNFALKERGYVPTVIPATEHEEYITLLRDTVTDRYERRSSMHVPSGNEQAFHNYLIDKAIDSTVQLKKKLQDF